MTLKYKSKAYQHTPNYHISQLRVGSLLQVSNVTGFLPIISYSLYQNRSDFLKEIGYEHEVHHMNTYCDHLIDLSLKAGEKFIFIGCIKKPTNKELILSDTTNIVPVKLGRCRCESCTKHKHNRVCLILKNKELYITRYNTMYYCDIID